MKKLILCAGADAIRALGSGRVVRKLYAVMSVYCFKEGICAMRKAGKSIVSDLKTTGRAGRDNPVSTEDWEDVLVGFSGQLSVIVADFDLPEGGGVAFLREARRMHPDAVGVLLCSHVDLPKAQEARQDGSAFRCVVKPTTSEDLLKTLELCGVRHEALREQRPHLERYLDGSLQLMKKLLQSADAMSFDRSQILRDYVRSYYRVLDASLPVPEAIELAAVFRAVGGLAVPGMVLHKARTGRELSFNETRLVESMSESGARLVSKIPGLEEVAKIIQYQDKGFDGSGFPVDTIRGEAIPFGARLLRVMSDILRLEATGLHRQRALAQLELDARLYDPEILKVCKSRWRSPSQRPFERVNRVVRLEDLGLLDLLAKPLHTITKMFIAPEGTLITRVLLKKIRDFEHLGLMGDFVEISVLRPLSPDLLPAFRVVMSSTSSFDQQESSELTSALVSENGAADSLMEQSGEVISGFQPAVGAVSLEEESTQLLPDISEAQVRERAVNE
jgi:response regulator RpfG family c-di-GMP phosphodiesterase